MLESIPVYLYNALLYASLLFLFTVGLTVIFGVLKILNLAHGSFYALGAYLGFTCISIVLSGLPPQVMYIQIITAAIITGVVGILFEFLLLRPIYKREESYQLLLTFGILLLLDDITKMVWGTSPCVVSQPVRFLGVFSISGIMYPTYTLLVIVAAIITAIILGLFFSQTKIGKVIRATAMDKDMAMALGANVPRLYTLVFMLGCFLAGFAGALWVPMQSAYPGIAMEILILSFVVLVIGGVGSLKGTFIGALIVGLVRAFGIVYFPEIELAIIYLVMIVVLLIKPEGLFGVKE